MLALMIAEGPIVATFHTSTTKSLTLSVFQGISAALAREDRRPHRGLRPGATLADGGARLRRRGDPQRRGRRVVRVGADAGRLSAGRASRCCSSAASTNPARAWRCCSARCPRWSRHFPDVEVLVVGRGDEDELREEAGELAGHLRFLGQVDDAEKASAMRSADVYCAPNTGGESFGIVLVEAMAAGTAVVASDLDAFRRVLEDGAAGRLVPVDDSRGAGDGADRDVVATTQLRAALRRRRRPRRCTATTGRWWRARSCGCTRRSPVRAPRCRWPARARRARAKRLGIPRDHVDRGRCARRLLGRRRRR